MNIISQRRRDKEKIDLRISSSLFGMCERKEAKRKEIH